MTTSTRHFLKLAGATAAALCLGTFSAHAQDSTLRIVVPYPPGGSSDLAARILASELQVIGPRHYVWSAMPYAVPTEALTNVTATFPRLLSKGWQGQLRITNLFNRQIEHPASAEVPSPSVRQPGRGVSAMLSYAF